MATRLPRGERPYKLTMSLTVHAKINRVLKQELGRKFTKDEMFGLANYCPELGRILIESMDMIEISTTTRDRLAQLQLHLAESALEAYPSEQGQGYEGEEN